MRLDTDGGKVSSVCENLSVIQASIGIRLPFAKSC